MLSDLARSLIGNCRNKHNFSSSKMREKVLTSTEDLIKIYDKYYGDRQKHVADKWVTPRALKERWLYRPQKELKAFRPVMREGFELDVTFRAWLQDEISNGRIYREALKEYVVLLKNHKSRVAWRSEFMPIAAAIMALLTTAAGVFGLPSTIPIIAAVFTFFLLSERTMLNDVKTATDELINILEAEK